LSGWRCKEEAISASHLEGFLTQSTFEKSKHARTHAREQPGGTEEAALTPQILTLLACLLPKLLKIVSAIVKKKTRFDDVHVCIEEKAIVERSPEYKLSEVGRSVVEMAERRRGCKRCLVQETLGICARFHYCLRLAPSTTSDNHLPQQQRNKETTRAFLPSFLRFHTLSFVSATSQKKLQP
jgi:hypothetical protein